MFSMEPNLEIDPSSVKAIRVHAEDTRISLRQSEIVRDFEDNPRELRKELKI